MANKKRSVKKNVLNLWYCGATVFALVAVIMIFVNNLTIVGTVTEKVHYVNNGLQTVFGFKDGSVEVYSFSILNLLTYLFLLVGLVLVVLKTLKVVKSNVIDFAALCLFIFSGVFFFLMPSFAVCPYAVDLGSLVVVNLGAGAIIGGILTLLAGCTIGLKLLLKR